MKMRDKTTAIDMPGAGRMPPAGRRSRRGFTLVEMIVVIVLVGIVSGMVAMFIRLPVQGYVDSAARADVTDTGDVAVRRIARDVRLALPNSIRPAFDGGGNQYLEFLITRTGGRYLAFGDNPNSGNILYFNDPSKSGFVSFDIVGPTPAGAQTIQVGDSVVVYNVNQSDVYSGINRAAITAVGTAANVTTVTMANNPYASITNEPSYHRFQVISGPVTYRWDATLQTLTRYWGYAITGTQPTSLGALAGAKSALIANGVRCPGGVCFTYNIGNQSNSLLEINFTLTAPATEAGKSGTVAMFQQVHVDNTP